MKKLFLIAIIFNLTTQAQQVSTLAGSTQGYADGTGSLAHLNAPRGIAIDAAGNLYFSDTQNNRIRKVTPGGVVTTIAGSAQGFADGTGTDALFYNPIGIALDANGNIYVADTSNHKIRKITPAGIVSTYAGYASGDGDGVGNQVHFNMPTSVTTDSSGNVYVCDFNNQKIKKIATDGTVTTIAGSTAGYADGVGNNVKFNYPFNIFMHPNGTLYIADNGNYKVRKMTPDGTVSTIAGSDTPGYLDGVGSVAQFNRPVGVTVDLAGNIYVADEFNYRIRKISQTGVVTTLAGSSQGFADGTGTAARFNLPNALVTNQVGTLYVADSNNHRIRKILLPPLDIVHNNFENALMNIYPNPTHETLNIEVTTILSSSAEIIIADITGKKLVGRQLEFPKTSINIEGYSKGIYFVSLIDDNKAITQKFIVE